MAVPVESNVAPSALWESTTVGSAPFEDISGFKLLLVLVVNFVILNYSLERCKSILLDHMLTWLTVHCIRLYIVVEIL